MATANSTRSRKKDDPRFAEKMLAQILAMPASLSERDLVTIESRLQHDYVVRRMALAILSKPGEHILSSAAKDRKFAESLAAIFVRLNGVTEFHQDLAKTLKQADVWLMFALAQRPDMQVLLDAAKAELNAPVH